MNTTIRHNECLCPWCNKKVDASSPVREMSEVEAMQITPEEMLSICINCHGFLAFNEDMTIRKLSPSEFINMPSETKIELMHILSTLQRIQAKQN